MATYIFKEGRWVCKKTGAPMLPDEDRAEYKPVKPYISSDIPDYLSPVTGELVSGRAQRREDLKKNDCYEVGPGDLKPKKSTLKPIELDHRDINERLDSVWNKLN